LLQAFEASADWAPLSLLCDDLFASFTFCVQVTIASTKGDTSESIGKSKKKIYRLIRILCGD